MEYKKKLWVRVLSVLSVTLLLILIWVVLSANWVAVVSSDFINYYVGAALVRDGKIDLLYDVEANYQQQDGFFKKYDVININVNRSQPFVSLFFLPFTQVNIASAYKVFGLINVLVIILIWVFSTDIFKNLGKYKYTFPLFAVLFFPVLYTLQTGQLSLVLTLLLLLVYSSLVKKRDLTAGILVGILSLIKLQYLVIVPFVFLLSHKKKNYFKGVLLAFAILMAVNTLMAGPFWLKKYADLLLSTEGPEFGTRVEEMWTFVAIFQAASWNKLLVFILNGIFYLVSLAWVYRLGKKAPLYLKFVFAVLSSLLFSYHLIKHDLVLLLVPILILINQALKAVSSTKRRYLTVSLLLYFMPIIGMFIMPYYAFAFVVVLVIILLNGRGVLVKVR